MNKEPARSAEEYDWVYARRYYAYLQRPGVSKKIKRQMNKRFRKTGKKLCVELGTL